MAKTAFYRRPRETASRSNPNLPHRSTTATRSVGVWVAFSRLAVGNGPLILSQDGDLQAHTGAEKQSAKQGSKGRPGMAFLVVLCSPLPFPSPRCLEHLNTIGPHVYTCKQLSQAIYNQPFPPAGKPLLMGLYLPSPGLGSKVSNAGSRPAPLWLTRTESSLPS